MNFASIPIASYVFFGLFVVSSIVHLVFCFLEKELARKITKPFCVAFLAIAIAIFIPQYPLVYVGMLLGWVGDICLLKKNKVWPFACGMIAFLIGHILYISQLMIIAKPNHYAYFLVMALYLILFILFMFRPINKVAHIKGLAFGGDVYFATLSLDLIWAVICCINGYFDYCFIIVLGAICFIVSDIYLAYNSFVSRRKRKDFYIMVTYLLAQSLIGIGFAFTLALI